jgi:fructose-bisphosphate aldolase, class II
MAARVEAFAYKLITEVFNSADTAPLAIAAILKAGSHDLGPKGRLIEDPAHWTRDQLAKRAEGLSHDKGPEGNFED